VSAELQFWNCEHWFAVQARLFHEGSTATCLSKQKIETFLPRILREQNVCGVTRLVQKAFFPGYFFARFTPALSLNAVKFAEGVLRVLSDAKRPIEVSDEVIHAIRGRADANGFLQLEPVAWKCGDRVEIQSGPMRGFIGRIEREMNDERRVSILLETIAATRVIVNAHDLASVKAA
jgi:transcriptional antiterminator RfaH